MSRRRTPTPIAKPDVVLLNAYKAIIKHCSVDFEKGMKIGDHLALLDDREATYRWRDFVESVAEKFADKSFSNSIFWIACLKQSIHPLHIVNTMKSDERLQRELSGSKPEFNPYLDGQHDHEDLPAAFAKLDKLVDVAIAFKTPYEQKGWFGQFDSRSHEEAVHFQMVGHVNACSVLFERFIANSKRAKNFCLTHVEKITTHCQGKEQSDLLSKLMDSLCQSGLRRNELHEYVLNAVDISETFEACLSLMSQKARPCDEIEEYGSGYHVGRYVVAAYREPAEYERVARLFGMTGVNEMTKSIGRQVFSDPERFMPLVESMTPKDARRLFAYTSEYSEAATPESALLLIDEYDRWYKNMGLGSVLTGDALWRLSYNYDMAQVLHQRGLLDYKSLAEEPGFKTESFCYRNHSHEHKFLKDVDSIRSFTQLCVEVGAQHHLKYMVDEDLIKGRTDGRLSDISLRKDLFEVLLETSAIDPDELLKTPLRIEKMIALGVSPHALQKSKKYSEKWVDKSFGADLGL